MPLTVTSITRSGVSLTVARCTTCVTPAIASSQTARSPMLPRTTSSRSVSGSVRLLQSALITPAGWVRAYSARNTVPTLPVAPVTSTTCPAPSPPLAALLSVRC